jgi:hypothetical protein
MERPSDARRWRTSVHCIVGTSRYAFRISDFALACGRLVAGWSLATDARTRWRAADDIKTSG